MSGEPYTTFKTRDQILGELKKVVGEGGLRLFTGLEEGYDKPWKLNDSRNIVVEAELAQCGGLLA